jgi:hypothetical protein
VYHQIKVGKSWVTWIALFDILPRNQPPDKLTCCSVTRPWQLKHSLKTCTNHGPCLVYLPASRLQSTSNIRTPDIRKMPISGHIWVRISNM